MLIDSESGIIAGHGRVLAARKLGMERVPIIRLDHLNETQKRAYILADNRLALNAGWDEEMLRVELAALTEADFDVDLLGFEADELGKYLTESQTSLTDEDETPSVEEFAISQPGDLWILGRHRLLCGDSTIAIAGIILQAQLFQPAESWATTVGIFQNRSGVLIAADSKISYEGTVPLFDIVPLLGASNLCGAVTRERVNFKI